MKKKDLKWLVSLEVELNPTNLLELSSDALDQLDRLDALKQDARLFRAKLIDQVSFSQKRTHYSVLQLIHSSDIIYSYLLQFGSRKTYNAILIAGIYRQTLVLLQDLLDTIICFTSRYKLIDFSQLTLTRYASGTFKESLRLNITGLKQALDNGRSDPFIDEIIIEELKSLLQSKSIKYNEVWYLMRFFKDFKLLEPSTTGEVILFLCEHDFNAPSFWDLLITIFHRVTSRQIDLRCQLDIVYMLEDTVKGIFMHHNIQGPFFGSSVRKQLLNHLANKKQLLRNQIRLFSHREKQGLRESDSIKPLQLNLSVPQFGYLIRLFIEAGVIREQEKTTIFRFFARNFTTNNSAFISPGSLQRKSINVEDSSAKAVRKILMQEVDSINRNFFR